MNIAIYARVSTDDQNVDMQVTELRSYCLARGWNVAHEYVDKGVSGSKANRPQLNRLMATAESKKFDAVLVFMSIFILPTLYVWFAREGDRLPEPEQDFEV